jgi:hypothetical protein
MATSSLRVFRGWLTGTAAVFENPGHVWHGGGMAGNGHHRR